MNFPPIHTLVPHADPMVLPERVIAADETSLVTELTISRDSLFFDDALQGVGAWIGIEYMAQTIAAYAGFRAQQENDGVKVGFLLGSRRYESRCPYFPLGSVLQITAHRILQHENGLGAFECRIGDSSGNVLATANVTVFQPENVNQFLDEDEDE